MNINESIHDKSDGSMFNQWVINLLIIVGYGVDVFDCYNEG